MSASRKYFILLLMLFSWIAFPKKAIAADYYVATTGSDTNNGTQSAPFKTFAKSTSVLKAGDNLYINSGTYKEQLKVTTMGTSSLPVNIQSVSGAKVIIDGTNSLDNPLWLTGTYINASGLEIINSIGYCANLQGSNNKIENSIVHECSSMGIYTDGTYENIIGNTVYHGSSINSGLNQTSWGSGIKVRVGGDYITIQGNKVYNNYGEGIAVTRGTNVTVKNNISYNNYSVNIYIDNSYNVLVDGNFTYNDVNNGFYRNGMPSDNIAIGEEFYSGWGAQLNNITITNNVANFGNHGIVFFGNDSGAANGGLKNSIITFNTLYNSINSEINIAYDTGQTGDIIKNNIVSQPQGKLILLTDSTGITLDHNFWAGNVTPPAYTQGIGDKSGDPKFNGLAGSDVNAFKLAATSTAIDAGIAVSGINADFAGTLRPSGNGFDMGAFEYISAQKTGDINNDGVVNILDFTLLSNAFGTNNTSCDLNSDGTVNVLDFTILSNNFGK